MPPGLKSSRAPQEPGKPLPVPMRRPKISAPWSIRTARGVQVLELAPFKKFPWLIHGFSTRSGGASGLDSGDRILNLGFTEWDSRENVLKNRAMFQSALGARDSAPVLLKQFHSAVVRSFDEASAEPLEGDASFTNAPGLLLGVQTADCVPILLVDPKKHAVAAIHAGWRGSLATAPSPRQKKKSGRKFYDDFCFEPHRPFSGPRSGHWRLLLRGRHRTGHRVHFTICRRRRLFRRTAHRRRTQPVAMAQHDAPRPPASAKECPSRPSQSKSFTTSRGRPPRRQHLPQRPLLRLPHRPLLQLPKRRFPRRPLHCRNWNSRIVKVRAK